MTRALVWVWLAACSAPAEVVPFTPGPLQSADGVLRDVDGRQVLLRGVNARVQGLFDVTFDDGRVALEPIPPFGDEDCRLLAEDLGLNHLRLPVNWSAIEPTRGTYDQAYLGRIGELVDACAAHGIATVVDLHQDAYSKHIGEDGAPLWAIVPPPTELLEGPLHDLSARRTSGQVLAAFRSFYRNEEGLRDAYADMAAALADALVDHPGAVALEVQNEPLPFGAQDLLDALHQEVAAAVRQVAPDLPVVFEPDSFRNLTDRATVPTPVGIDNAIYGPHIYTEVFTTGWASEDQGLVRASVAAALEEAQFHGAALYVGEFGHDPRHERGRTYIRTALDAFDDTHASWALWLYEEWSQDSWGLFDASEEGPARQLRPEGADLVARPFPIAVDGTVSRIHWSADEATLTVQLDDAGALGHVIAASPRWWPDGVVATCDGEPVVTTRDRARLQVPCGGHTLVVAPSR